MSVTLEKLTSNRVKLRFEIDTDTFDQAMNAAYRKNVGQIVMPGFRRGKAPRKVIESYYGESVFFEDAIDSLFPTVYQAAIDEHNLRPVDQPDVEWDNIGGGQPLTFSLEVFVSPDVVLGNYTGLEAEEPVWAVADEQVDARIDADRNRIARWVETDRAVQSGDRATIDYAGSIDGVPFDGGTAQNMPLDIGSGTFIPGFEEQVIGMTVGEEKDITVTFPEDYRAQDLAGKDAVFHVKLNENKLKELPELDDEFAQDVSEFDTFEEYKANIKSTLEETAQRQAQVRSDNSLIRAAAVLSEVDIPEPMIDSQIDVMMRDFQMNLMYQGMNLDSFLQITQQSLEEFRGKYRDDAIERIRAELTIQAIRDKEGLEPTDEQVEAQIARLAKDMGREVDAYKETLRDEDMGYIRDAAAAELVLDLLKKTAVFVAPQPEAPADEAPEQADAEEEKPAKKTASRKKKAQQGEEE